ncbi:hypothetical protein MJO29_014235 [Puccinia striiformis f. sp. tritici]|nr:hypothetical protein MJO29_014235 [Puccinia striiformis f. sp. tritici]
MLFGMAQPSENDPPNRNSKAQCWWETINKNKRRNRDNNQKPKIHLNLTVYLIGISSIFDNPNNAEEIDTEMKSLRIWSVALLFHGLVCMDHLGPRIQYSYHLQPHHFTENERPFSTYGSSTLSYTVGGNPSIIEHGEKKLSVSTLSEYGSVRVCNRGRSPVDYFVSYQDRQGKTHFTPSQTLPCGDAHQVFVDSVKIFMNEQ